MSLETTMQAAVEILRGRTDFMGRFPRVETAIQRAVLDTDNVTQEMRPGGVEVVTGPGPDGKADPNPDKGRGEEPGSLVIKVYDSTDLAAEPVGVFSEDDIADAFDTPDDRIAGIEAEAVANFIAAVVTNP